MSRYKQNEFAAIQLEKKGARHTVPVVHLNHAGNPIQIKSIKLCVLALFVDSCILLQHCDPSYWCRINPCFCCVWDKGRGEKSREVGIDTNLLEREKKRSFNLKDSQ